MVKDSNILNLLNGKFWSRMAYQIGKYDFSLDDIEHGILRANRPHPAKKDNHFSHGDSRIKYCVRKLDPRIHFALNCGAKGCPPIAFYTIDNLERGLQLACQAFCTNETQIFPDENKMVISRLLLWYGTDFVENPDEEIIDYVSSKFRPDDEIKHKFDQLKSSCPKIKVEFSDYNWELNIKI
ncbi:DUF547 domain-containing [Brachionus plicatilis]|uniref:DUF547 domain-containing n=1 Tax=Brachionus plicatilis TaxID=10195 RepID=A0A3M7PEA1_BRAPC|nr:DUF547 domain-containing [Brachionus plicatilis]